MKEKNHCFLAFDLGASNGRAVLGLYDGETVRLRELHRFRNSPVMKDGILCWDIEYLLSEIKKGFSIAVDETCNRIESFGIDTWGVDYGLLGKDLKLLSWPRCYWSSRREDMEKAFLVMPFRELFARTGNASESFNTLFQLYRRRLEHDEDLRRARRLLLMPDLLAYLLTGEIGTEYTIATTTMLLNAGSGCWDSHILEKFGFSPDLFTDVYSSGSVRGCLSDTVAQEIGCDRIPYVAVGCHDTASAVAAIPCCSDSVFCSSGTWSLFGVENTGVMLGRDVLDAGFTNEGTVQNGKRTLKSIMGMRLIQECRRIWEGRGLRFTWDQITEMAEKERPFAFIIDPDCKAFFNCPDVEKGIKAYCRLTGQGEPVSPGQIARCIFESLALKYKLTFMQLSELTGHGFGWLNMVGGGSSNDFLNQLTADSLGVPVIAGPVECAALGNILVQAMALGYIPDIHGLRNVVRRSFETKEFKPSGASDWEATYHRLLGYMDLLN